MSGYGVGYYRDVNDRGEAKPNYGKWGAKYVILVDPDTGLPYRASGGGGGGGDASAANQLSTQGTVAPGTSATKSTLTGSVYNNGLQTLTTGQQIATQCDVNGNAWSRIKGTASAGADALSIANFAYISGHNQSTGSNSLLPVVSMNFDGTNYNRPRGNTKGTFVVGAPLTNTNRSAAIGTATTVLAAANATRSGFVMQNLSSTADIWYAFGIPAVVGGLGCFKLGPGATFFMESNVIDTAAINVIASAAATNLSALEY